MLFDDTFKTVEKASEGVFRSKGSKFIGYAYPIATEGEIREHLKELKALHPKARHWCWAARLSRDRSVFKLSDDGEPAGSAGRPILNTLLSNDLTDTLIVVVRYFGGTLLGVPGLINAYKTAAAEAITANTIIAKAIHSVYGIAFLHADMNRIMTVVKDERLAIVKQVFDNDCYIELMIRDSKADQLLQRLRTGSVKIKFIKQC